MNLPKIKWRSVGILLSMILLFSLFGIPNASGQDETVTLHIYKFWDEEPDSYTLTYDLNGGEGSPPPAQTGFANTTIAVTEEIPIRTDHIFVGWSLVPDGPVDYSSGDPILMDSDKTLYAVWVVVLSTFTVTLHANHPYDDVGQVVVIPVAANTYFFFPEPTDVGIFPKPLLVFNYWNTQADALGENFLPDYDYLVTENVDFYAVWRPIV